MALVQLSSPSVIDIQSARIRSRSSQSSTGDLAYSPVSGIPDLRRLRVSSSKRDRPCDTCRKRKTRCAFSEASQICHFCRTHGKPCTFLEKAAPRRRKLDATLRRHSSSDQSSSSNASQTDYTHRESLQCGFVPSIEGNESDVETLDACASSIMRDISPAVFAAVLDVYFATIWSSYPIVAREDVIGSLHASSAEASQTLLAAICIVTCSTIASSSHLISVDQSMSLARFAEYHLRHFTDPSDSKTIKASLLLLNCSHLALETAAEQCLDRRDLDSFVAEVDAAAPPTDLFMSALESYQRWKTVLADKTAPSHLFVGFQDTVSIKTEDGNPVYAVLEKYRSLSHIVSQLAAVTASTPADPPAPARQVLLAAKPIQLRLKKWFASLPADLHVDHTDDRIACSACSLHLAYYTAEILLHRQIVAALHRDAGVGAGVDATLTQICRSAARTRLISVMDFANRLRPRHWRGFWFCPASCCFAAVAAYVGLLRDTTVDAAEAAFYEDRKVEFRWTVGVSEKYAPFLRRAVEVLEEQ